MSVVQKHMGLGQFAVNLTEDFPYSMPERVGISEIGLMGHIVITQSRVRVHTMSDADFRAQARYVGVITRKPTAKRSSIEGAGLLWWLGDGADIGVILRGSDKQVFVNESFNQAITDILAVTGSPITKGSVETPAGTFTQTFDLVSQRRAIEETCAAFGSEFRVTNDFKLDAGASGFLYAATPSALVARRGVGGLDPEIKGTPSEEIEVASDVEDWVATVIVAAEGTGATLQTAEQTLGTIPFKDPQGNDSKRAIVVNEPSLKASEASTRATELLDLYGTERRAVDLILENYNVAGEFTVGDLIYVYDPQTELVDTSKEVPFRGEILQPIAIRVVGMSWPITEGMGVYYRDSVSTSYADITDYVVFETGAVQVEVGADSRNLVAGTSAVLDARISIDPDGNDVLAPDVATAASTPWTGATQIDDEGKTTSSIVAVWNEPDNTDSSTVTDGSHYDIRYRPQGDTEYEHQQAPWGETSAQILGLSPGVVYEICVSAVDVNGNQGTFSSNEVVTAPTNSSAPSQPAAPTLAGNELNIQVTHDLQKQITGDLEDDLDHLNVYGSTSSGFTPSSANYLGQIKAVKAHMALGLDVIASFPLADTSQRYVVVTAVNRSGSESPKSPEATVTAVLLDDSHISDLSASKITAGTISAQVVEIGGVAGAIQSTNYVAKTSGWQIASDGSAEFNNVRVYGDIIADVWDGADPANLATADTTATAGFYLDSSVGAAQFSGNLYLTGKLQALTSVGAVGLEIDDGVIAWPMNALSYVNTSPYVSTIETGTSPNEYGELLIAGMAHTNSTGLYPRIHLITEETDPNSIILGFGLDGNLKITENNSGVFQLLNENGTAAWPSYSFGDADTGMYLWAANVLAFSAGGERVVAMDRPSEGGRIRIYGYGTHEGGQLELMGGSSYTDRIYIDRYQDNLRFVFSAQVKFNLDDGGKISNTNPYGCDAYYTGGQTYTDATWTTMTMNTERYDSGGNLSGSVFTIPVAGFYIFGATARINGDPYHMKIMVSHSSGSSYELEVEPFNDAFASVMGMRYCNASETLTPKFYQDSAGSMSTITNSQRFWVARLA